MTRSPAAVAACALEVSVAVLSPLVDPAAALSLLGGTAAALSLCAVAAMAIGALIVQALIAATDMVLARQRSARLQPGLTTAVAAGMTPTATGFARAGTSRTARRRVGRWCSKQVMKSSGLRSAPRGRRTP
jgi:hypothetical protein